MNLDNKKKTTLGIFVFIGLLILIGIIYHMGASRHLFGDRVNITATFKNVEGLREGNNVRFSGIKVGVVKNVFLVSDSTVKTVLMIDEGAAKFIKTDSRATISSEGLMGNKVVSITSGSETAPSVSSGDELYSEEPVGLENIMKRINETTQQTSRLTKNLADISEKVRNGKGPLGKFIYDSTLIVRINRSLSLIETSGRNVKTFTDEINEMAVNLNEGNGLATRLLHDEEWAKDVEASLDSLRKTSTMMTKAGRDLHIFMRKLNEEKGILNQILSDSAVAKDFHEAIINIKQGTEDLDQVMKTVDNSWLLNLFSGDD